MKKLLVFTALLCAVSFSFATIRTVNNMPGSDADFTTVAAAITASTPGDTIYVQPSINPYSTASLDRRVVLMGPGHNPSFSLYNSQINVLTLQPGSDNSIIKGLVLPSVQSSSGATIVNVLFSGCLISNNSASALQVNSGVYNNWVFEGCAFIAGSNPVSFSGIGANLIIRNCYAQSNAASITLNSVPSGALIDHCILSTINASVYGGAVLGSNVELRNSIIISNASTNFGVGYNCGNCIIEDNILWNESGTFPSSGLSASNFVNASPQFEFFYISGEYRYDWNFQIGQESPGINTASDGSNIGIYGGIFNYSHTGADGGTPQIVDFSLDSSTAPAGGTITIHLNANGSGQ